MEAPRLPPRRTQNNGKRGEASNAGSTRSLVATSATDLQPSQQHEQGPPVRRRPKEVEEILSRAPSVPSTWPPEEEMETHTSHDGGQEEVDGIALRLAAVGVDDAPQLPPRNDKYREAFGDTVPIDQPPPPYNAEFTPKVAHSGVAASEKRRTVSETPSLPNVTAGEPQAPAIQVTPIEGADTDAPTESPQPALHRRCYSDISTGSRESEPSAPPEGAVKGPAKPPRHTHLNSPDWRLRFAETRGHASDVEVRSYPDAEDEQAEKLEAIVPLEPEVGTKVAESSGNGNNNGPPSPGPGPGPGPSGNGSPYFPRSSTNLSTAPIEYPTLSHAPARNPLHPEPTWVELREEWEPGMDPSFGSRAKISSLFTGKGWKETPWKKVWIELVPEDGWKLVLYDVVKVRAANGETAYQRKSNTPPVQVLSLRYSSVTPPRTGYGSSRPDILCIRLVSGRYIVLSFPSSTSRSAWSKGVKSAVEMATRAPLQRGGG
ncbi:uncharacterized protein EV422DRAFT_384297 [Fimicolochytrium jonesii]|uniref:uncharacterized protein n=1 Tax=Fimicolochytrium jonesii TaxID=1396493 RepID=UPI0022FE4660|nr:uncharacterized protein EV422DRAFT_384297 [Fimicolochytrium jonesii]KAI8822923.1 hypothetical protein EV422DRAFT_384297 [Fimicolochytrium jonesii]